MKLCCPNLENAMSEMDLNLVIALRLTFLRTEQCGKYVVILRYRISVGKKALFRRDIHEEQAKQVVMDLVEGFTSP